VIAKPFLVSLNHVLAQSSWARTKLLPFAGRQARLQLPIGPIDFLITDDGYAQTTGDGADAVVDVTITLPLETPFLALQGKEKVFAAARIEGSADFAEALGFVLRNLSWDAEADLARVVGDIAAHRLMGGLNAFVGWQKQAAQRLAENVAEYASEEQTLLLGGREMAGFKDRVAALGNGINALEQRLQKLSARP
jgi:ubiquinone biosynthesis protein UbiJ